MTSALAGWFQTAIFCAVLVAVAPPLGSYMERIFTGKATLLERMLRPFEHWLYRIVRVHPDEQMAWPTYTFALLALSIANALFLYAMLRWQATLPLNPQRFGPVSPLIAWNTALSFITTTDWQTYSGESTMSYLSQMAGLAWQNFMAGGIGLAACIALIRAFAHGRRQTLGNFWVDLTRSLLYVLLPLSVAGALLFAWQGVPQNFHPYVAIASPEGFQQNITGGPMASQEIIKLLGGNGGGFVGANSASPNENPTPLANLLQLLAMFLIPAALPFTFGKMVRDERVGRALFVTMAALFVAGCVGATLAENAGNPIVHALGVAGGNFEGKETRFGVGGAGLSLAVATDSTVGASNFAYDSLTPLGGLVALADMQLGEIAFGGVGSGLAGLLLFVIVTVFIAGLMVGRTPEFLGKKIEAREMKYVALGLLAFPLAALVPTALASVEPQGLAVLGNAGPHGFSEILYAFTSVTGNNGSSFAALAQNPFYDLLTAISMMLGRYAALIPTLALAGALAAKPRNQLTTKGTLDAGSAFFVVLLLGVVLLVGLLTFVPADALGPVAEQFFMRTGTLF